MPKAICVVASTPTFSYRYPAAAGMAIDDLSLEIPKGQWIALIGPTGAGKTTLANLILGLLAPTSGNILVDGLNLRDNLPVWQRGIGYVPQSVYLMDDTVRRNVAFGSPEEEIDDGRVWQALRAAHVDSLVRSLPGGLDAVVGEKGGRSRAASGSGWGSPAPFIPTRRYWWWMKRLRIWMWQRKLQLGIP